MTPPAEKLAQLAVSPAALETPRLSSHQGASAAIGQQPAVDGICAATLPHSA